MPFAYILINTAVGLEDIVLQQIHTNSYIREAYIVYGQYDLILRIEFFNLDELKKIVDDLRELDHVKSTMTMVVS